MAPKKKKPLASAADTFGRSYVGPVVNALLLRRPA